MATYWLNKLKNYSNQDVLIKGYIHSNNYSNNNNNNNNNSNNDNSNNNFNDNNNNYGTGIGKVESSAYHREPCPPESGVAPLASASNPVDTPVRVTVESQWQLRQMRKLPSNSFSFLMAAGANKGAIPGGLATNQE